MRSKIMFVLLNMALISGGYSMDEATINKADAYSKESAEQNPGRSRWHAKKAVRVTNYEKLLELLSQMSATIENMKNDDAAQCQGRGNGRVERDKKEDEYLMVKLGDQETFTKAEVLDIIMGTRTARRAN